MVKELISAVLFLAVLAGCESKSPSGPKVNIKQFCQEIAVNAVNDCDKSVRNNEPAEEE